MKDKKKNYSFVCIKNKQTNKPEKQICTINKGRGTSKAKCSSVRQEKPEIKETSSNEREIIKTKQNKAKPQKDASAKVDIKEISIRRGKRSGKFVAWWVNGGKTMNVYLYFQPLLITVDIVQLT